MHKLVRGVQTFRRAVFTAHRDTYQRLRDRQAPETLFITCSDSRVAMEALTQTGPGDIFVLRNAGNLIPPFGAGSGGEAATIEYAVTGLAVKHVVVCGHSRCGAMRALLDPAGLAELPVTARWLRHAEATRQVVRSKYTGLLDFDDRWLATVEENVLIQLEHLKTHPSVAAGMAAGELSLYGWVFDLEHGQVRNYDPAREEFFPLPEGEGAEIPAAFRARRPGAAVRTVRRDPAAAWEPTPHHSGDGVSRSAS
jgi:carbonic anhydrase